MTQVWPETEGGLAPLSRGGATAVFECWGTAGVLPLPDSRLVEGFDGEQRPFVNSYSFELRIGGVVLAAFAAGRAMPGRGTWLWELFTPGVRPRVLYEYEIRNRDSGGIPVNTDPYGRRFDVAPDTATAASAALAHSWGDGDWVRSCATRGWRHALMSVHKGHLDSWRRNAAGALLNYRQLADHLIPCVLELGFADIQLIPVCRHRFKDSCESVDRRHTAHIGVPESGVDRELLNSDSTFYEGRDITNDVWIGSAARAAGDRPHAPLLTLPPLAGLVLERVAG